jgi:hypothetical protein
LRKLILLIDQKSGLKNSTLKKNCTQFNREKLSSLIKRNEHACDFFRAYINFLNDEEVYYFTNKFDGYVFVDDRGKYFDCRIV